MNKTPFNLQVDLDQFIPASEEDKAYLVQMRSFASELFLPALAFIALRILLSFMLALYSIRNEIRLLDLDMEYTGFLFSSIKGIQKLKGLGCESFIYSRWAEMYRKRLSLTYQQPFLLKYSTELLMALTILSTISLLGVSIWNGLSAEDYLEGGNDFSTYYIIGSPKDQQSLDEVRQLLLAEVEKLKKGEFSDELLKAIIRNMKRNELIGQQNNRNRTYTMMNSFIYQIPYEDVVRRLDRLDALTKEDIVRVANAYLRDNYVCVYKEQSDKDTNPEKVEKPAITPIEMNRDAQSQFCTDLLAMKAERQKPQFLDFHKDLSVSTLDNGVELLYRQNKENELAQLNFVIGKGSDQDAKLDFAGNMLDYLGTADLTAEQYKTQLYYLAAEAWTYVGEH